MGSDGFNAPYAIATIDRDESGAQVQFHADDYFSAFAPPGAFLQHLVRLSLPNGTTRTLDWNPYPASSAWAPNDLSFAPIGMARTDGYQMGDVTIQGVRAYDPSIAQWVSPDAYAGTTTDPGSQNPFMWNGNNPIAYSDPSGFSPDCTDPAPGQPPNGCLGGVNWSAQYSFLKGVWSSLIWVLPGGPEEDVAVAAGEAFFQHFGTSVADMFRGAIAHLLPGGRLVQSGRTSVIEVGGGEAALRKAFQSLAKSSGATIKFAEKDGEVIENFKASDGTSVSLRDFSSTKSGNLPTLQITPPNGGHLKLRALRIPR